MKTKSMILVILMLSMTFSPLFSGMNVKTVQAESIQKSVSQDDVVVVRVYYESMEDIELLSGFDLFEFNNKEDKYVLVAIDKNEIHRIEALGFIVQIDRIETTNYQTLFEVQMGYLESTGMEIQTIPGYSCYRTVEETYAAAQMIADMYPNLASWFDVGDSWEKSVGQSDGYDMMVLKLTNTLIQAEKPVVFMIAAIHAREYATAELALRYAEHLVNNYNTDPDITWVLDHHEIHIMFQANPDGRKEAEAGLSWRKNTNENYCGVTSNSRGADLNRNFGYAWGGAGTSTNPCDATYRGPYAESEPETVAIRDYMLSLFPDQRGTGAAPDDTTGIFLDIHSYGGYVLWPWGYSTSTTPNDAQLQTLGRKFAYYNGYLPGQTGQDLYTCSGVTNDFSYGELGIPSYTFEVGTTFFQSCSTFEGTIYPANLQALLYAAKVPRTPYMTPLGPDALNVSVSESVVFEGQSVFLSAEINDTRYNNSNGTEATQNIAAAEFYVDTPYWEVGAAPLSMSSVDGAYDEKTENVSFTINTSGWSQGRHTLFVRGQDLNGNWGAVSAVFLTVEASDNEPPIADDLGVVTEEDLPVSVELTGFDPDGNPLTFNVIDMPAHGTLSGTSPFLTYTPEADYFGDDLFTYQANDGIANSPLATVSITVSPVNDAPIAMDQSVSVEINSPVDIVLEGIDVDGDPVTFSLLSSPAFGSLSGTAPNLQYTPNTGFTGDDSFSFIVSDGLLDSEAAYVMITVNPPGPVQVFWDDFESDLGWVVNPFGTDNATTGLWEWADPESIYYNSGYTQLGDAVSGTKDLVTGALAGSSAGSYDIDNGITSIRSPEISLPAGRELTLSFSYYLSHASNSSTADYLRVTVIGDTSQLVFEELGAANYDYAVWERFSADISSFAGQKIRILLEAADASTASLVEAAVDDVLIEGLLTNTAPIANAQSISVDEDSTAAITLSGSDVDGDLLTFSVVSDPTHGTLSGTTPNLTYTPDADFHGSDSFTFKVNDGTVDSAPATVSITVNSVNDAPTADNQTVTTDENAPIAITLTGSDVDGDTLNYVVVGAPTHGTLSGEAPTLTYTPDADFNGTDSFTFKVNDGVVDSVLATVDIMVNPVNDAPVAYGQSLATDEDTPLGITLTGFDPDGDSLSFAVEDQPAHGSLSGTAPNLTYTPDADFNGTDSFTFAVSDGEWTSQAAEVSIVVNAVNDAPTAESQSVSGDEDTPLAIELNGSDVDGDVLAFSIVASPSHGSLSGTVPNLTYTPNANFNGSDSFTFKVNDGTVDSNLATVSITVDPVNDMPIASVQSITVDEDSSVDYVLEGSDVDGDALAFSIVASPSHGALSGTAPNLTYTPNANFNGTDSFTFKVNDGTVDSNLATVSITVNPVNDMPIASAQSITVDEDSSVNFVLESSDVDGDVLTFSIVASPSHGMLSGTAPNLTYTPDANFHGTDSFTFKVNDGMEDSGLATVNITVDPVNDMPIANAQSITIDEDISVDLVLEGSDVDGDVLSYVVVSEPTHGILNGTESNLTYTPNANFNGVDSFTFKVNDGTVDSIAATVSITVDPVNDAPIANEQSVVTYKNTSLEITLMGMDVDDDPLEFNIITNPTHGVLSGTAPYLTYSPFTGYTGADSFEFTVSDGLLTSNIAVISIAITAVNSEPVANDQSVETDEDAPVGITLTGFDSDGDILSFTVEDQPTHGTLSGTAPNLTYTPDADIHGTDNFTFKVNDGTVDSNPATVSITINPVNDAPIAESQSVSGDEDTPLAIELIGSDVDGDALIFIIESDPSNGTLSGIAPNLTYTPNANYNGLDSFTFKVSDGTVNSSLVTVNITVNSVNDAPIANAQSISVDEDSAAAITLSGSDVDGDLLTFIVVSDPTHGTLSGTAPNLTYTPDADFHGSDSFTFTVNDGTVDSAPATVSITVNSVNDAPTADSQTVTTDENAPIAITLTGSDVDGDTLNYVVVGAPSHGTLSGAVPALTYTPDADFNGTDNFTFKVNDGVVDSVLATVDIMVNPVNDAPVAYGQSLATDEDTPLGITLAGFDPDGDPLSFAVEDQPAHGSLSGTAPNLTYTPDVNFDGTDSFTFAVSDGEWTSQAAEVSIVVNAVNDAPIAVSQSVSGDEDTPLAIELNGSDIDGDVLAFSIVASPSHGTLSGTAPNLIYTPNANFNGSDSFTFKVNDEAVDSNLATVSISVDSVNDMPIASAQSVTVDEDSSVDFVLEGSDVDGDALTFSIVASPSHGTLSGTAPNLTYIPDANFHGTDSFTFKVNDGTVDSNLATVSITVNPVNDKPIAFPQNLTTTQDTPIEITLLGSDVDDDILTFIVTNGPSHGDLTGNDANRFYTPAGYFAGIDSFTYVVFDGTENSEPATVIIEVTSINYLPIVYNQEVLTDEESSVQIGLSGMDPNGDLIDFYILEEPLHGLLSGTSPNLTYTPDQDYNGNDHFTFYASDGVGDSDPGMISITINAINDAPNAIDQVLTLEQDTSIEVVLTGQDVDDDELTFIIVDLPVYGTLTGSSPDFIYTPQAGFSGEDSLTFVASDGEMESNLGTITFIVTPSGPVQVFWDDFESNLGWAVNPNQTDPATSGIWERAIPQTVTYNSYTTQLGTTVSGVYDLVTGRLAGSSAGSYDIDGGKTSIRSPLIDLPSGKDLSLSFSYYLAHLNNASSADYLRVTVIGESNQTVFQVLGSGTYVSAVWRTAEVNLSSFAGQTIYLLIEAADDGGASLVEAGIDDVLIIAKSPNLPPTAYPQTISLTEDTEIAITLSGFDPNGDPLSYEIVTNPQNGSISGSLPEVVYTPFADFNGTDQFSFVVSDGDSSSDPAVIQMTVAPVNDAPEATAKMVMTSMDTPIQLKLEAVDADGDSLTFSILEPPSRGVLTGITPNVVYTPDAGFIGDDVFSFAVSDGVLQSSAEVNITIVPPGPVTVFFDDFESVQGWTTNPFGSDTATAGIWERAIPAPVSYNGDKQLAAYSGSYDLVTGKAAASWWWWWFRSVDDVNNGVTSIRSPEISLPAGRELTLSLRYYFAHASNASTSDYFRLSVIGNTTAVIYEELADGTNDDAVWELMTVDLSDFSGQTVTLLIETSDGASDSLIEAAVDDVLIIAE